MVNIKEVFECLVNLLEHLKYDGALLEDEEKLADYILDNLEMYIRNREGN